MHFTDREPSWARRVPCKLTGRQNSVGCVAASARLSNSLAFNGLIRWLPRVEYRGRSVSVHYLQVFGRPRQHLGLFGNRRHVLLLAKQADLAAGRRHRGARV